MHIKIKDTELDLKYTLRTNVIYESIVGKQLDYNEFEQVTVVATLLYSNILATMQANHMEMKLTYDEYMNWLDDNNGMMMLNDYAIWLSEQMQVQFGLVPEKVEAVKKKQSKKKTA